LVTKRAQVGEVPRGQRGRDRLLNGDDGDALERKRHDLHYSRGDEDQSKPAVSHADLDTATMSLAAPGRRNVEPVAEEGF
jgi:hypothetical protein